MRGGESCVVIGALAVAMGCGKASSGGLPTSGTDLSCGDSMYISNGVCARLPPFSDAGVAFNHGDSSSLADASNDGSPSDDGGDAPATAAPGPSDPLTPCAVASDVFFVRGNQGDPTLSETYTNLDANFQASVLPPSLMVTVTRGSPGGALAYLRLTRTSAIPASALGTPGTYEAGSQGLNVDILANAQLMDSLSGTITIDDVQIDEVDGASVRLHSLLLWYEFVSFQSQRITGCLRYIDQAPPGGTGDTDAGLWDSSSGGD
jgi:hypothetical protein